MSFSSMNNWGKLKIELVPWAEQAFVLICQGLFKNAALAGSFAAIGKQVQDISGGGWRRQASSVSNSPWRTLHRISRGYVGSLESKVHFVSLLRWSLSSQITYCQLPVVIMRLCDAQSYNIYSTSQKFGHAFSFDGFLYFFFKFLHCRLILELWRNTYRIM